MKLAKLAPLIALVTAIACLTGCGRSSLYTNYRDLEQIQVIQALGVDRSGPESLRLSVASGADVGGRAPTILSIREASISAAMEQLQEYAPRETLYFAHTQFLLLGEDTAKSGIAEFLDYIQRNPQMRTDVELFVVRGSTAETMITRSGDGTHDAADELHALLRDLERQNGSQVFSATDVSRRLAESGAALIHAIVPAESEGVNFSGGGGLFMLSAGYGVLRGDQLIGYILGDAAKGVELLDHKLTGGPVSVRAGENGLVTLKLTGGETSIKPLWNADGSLRALQVEAKLQAAVAELENPELSAAENFTGTVAELLSARAAGWLDRVLRFSAAQNADFLGLGQQLRRMYPQRFAAMPRPWQDTLPELDFEISVKTTIEHSYDNFGPVNTEGRGMGGTA